MISACPSLSTAAYPRTRAAARRAQPGPASAPESSNATSRSCTRASGPASSKSSTPDISPVRSSTSAFEAPRSPCTTWTGRSAAVACAWARTCSAAASNRRIWAAGMPAARSARASSPARGASGCARSGSPRQSCGASDHATGRSARLSSPIARPNRSSAGSAASSGRTPGIHRHSVAGPAGVSATVSPPSAATGSGTPNGSPAARSRPSSRCSARAWSADRFWLIRRTQRRPRCATAKVWLLQPRSARASSASAGMPQRASSPAGASRRGPDTMIRA